MALNLPYKVTLLTKTVNGDGSTSFTFNVKDSLGTVVVSESSSIDAGQKVGDIVAIMKLRVKELYDQTIQPADVPIGTNFSLMPWQV